MFAGSIKILLSILFLLYPLFVYFGISYFDVRFLGVLLLLAGTLNFFVLSKRSKQSAVFFIVAFFIGAIVVVSNSVVPLRLYPFFVNLAMLMLFTLSLFYPPTVIELFARQREPELSHDGVLYTRRIAILWCVFFVFNAAAALYTALATSLEVWVLYNGFIAYILMGTLFCGEYIVRLYYFKKKRA